MTKKDNIQRKVEQLRNLTVRNLTMGQIAAMVEEIIKVHPRFSMGFRFAKQTWNEDVVKNNNHSHVTHDYKEDQGKEKFDSYDVIPIPSFVPTLTKLLSIYENLPHIKEELLTTKNQTDEKNVRLKNSNAANA